MKTNNLLLSVLFQLVLVTSALSPNTSQAQGEIVQLMPTNASYSITHSQNIGITPFYRVQQPYNRLEYFLDNQKLIVTRTVFYYLPGRHSDIRREFYTQGGAEYYEPAGFQEIFIGGVTGGIPRGGTNNFPASSMQPIYWYPTMIGSITIVDGELQTDERGGPTLYFARNLSDWQPHVLDILCQPPRQAGVHVQRKFTPGKREFYSLGLDKANAARPSGQSKVTSFSVGWESFTSFPAFSVAPAPPKLPFPYLPQPPKQTRISL